MHMHMHMHMHTGHRLVLQSGKKELALKRFREPRGRMDENGWGQTL